MDREAQKVELLKLHQDTGSSALYVQERIRGHARGLFNSCPGLLKYPSLILAYELADLQACLDSAMHTSWHIIYID